MTHGNEPSSPSMLMPVVYLPHGGGPLPLLGEKNHKPLIDFLKNFHLRLPTPQAILMISAHWESGVATVSSSIKPEMIYDYGGFPQETYHYQYPAPGNPGLAAKVADLFKSNAIECRLDSYRGYDHGTFVPLMLMYPKADIPVVQVSLLRSLDPLAHINLGKALGPLREEGVLIIGSGMSFHNLRGSDEQSEEFDNWLTALLTSSNTAETKAGLIQWKKAPSARQSHPREEHLLPLHVCFGAASLQKAPATRIFSRSLFGKKISGFMWGE